MCCLTDLQVPVLPAAMTTGADDTTEVDLHKTVVPIEGKLQSVRLGSTALLKTIDVRVGATCVVGRGVRADERIADDPVMSRTHFEIECSESRVVIRDLGSRNGTRLNGNRVSECTIYDGDLVMAGSHLFRVQFVQE